jgi:hypothetical protein
MIFPQELDLCPAPVLLPTDFLRKEIKEYSGYSWRSKSIEDF